MTLQVAIIGNCQVWGLGACLQRRYPEWKVETIFVGSIKSADQSAEVAERMADYDAVLSQPLHKASYGPLTTDALRNKTSRLYLFPGVLFSGFHPDATMLALNGAWMQSAIGSFHSRLAAASFVCGLPADRALELFNAYIYRVLGYFDEYQKAEEFQIGRGRQADFDLRPLIADWKRRGAFMHQPMHPKIGVSSSFADVLCERLGAKPAGADGLPDDPLAEEACWPVYPELARVLDVEGSTIFKKKGGEEIALADFISDSYERYRAVDMAAIADDQLAKAVAALQQAVV